LITAVNHGNRFVKKILSCCNSVQRRSFTKWIPNLKDLDYWQRLRKLNYIHWREIEKDILLYTFGKY